MSAVVGVWSRERLVESAVREVERFYNELGEACKMQHLTQQFSRRCHALDVRLIDVLENDNRLVIKRGKRGGYMLAPRAALEAEFPGADEVKFWTANNARVL